MNLFRIIKEDTVVDGQPLRAGTAVTAHIAMIHVDEDLFKNHTEFRPERFLENDDLDKKLIPFGIGRRSCLGESLAKAELYLVFTFYFQIYQNLNFSGPWKPAPRLRPGTSRGNSEAQNVGSIWVAQAIAGVPNSICRSGKTLRFLYLKCLANKTWFLGNFSKKGFTLS